MQDLRKFEITREPFGNEKGRAAMRALEIALACFA
jgi:hypothetical protein